MRSSHRAFSTLVADRQFSTLGVALLALLARVGKIVGLPQSAVPVPAEELKPGQQPHIVSGTGLTQTGVDRGEVVERVFGNREAEQSHQAVSREEGVAFMMGAMKGREASEDVSEGKSLDEKLVSSADKGATKPLRADSGIGDFGKGKYLTGEAVAHGGLVEKTLTEAERKRKRRKKGNAIDDLFAGLS